MQYDFDIASIILMITIIQGVYLGSVLVIGRTRNHPSTYLGLALIVFSVGLIYDVLRHINFLDSNPELTFLPIKIYYLPAVLTYLFARKLTPAPLTCKDNVWLIPSIIEFSILTLLYFLPPEIKSTLENPESEWAQSFFLYQHLWIPFSIVLMVMCYRLIRQNRDRFMNLFSGSQDTFMRWAMKSSIFAAVFCSCFLVKFIVDSYTYDTYIFPVITALILILIFSIGTWGIKQSFVDFDYEDFKKDETRPKNNLREESPKKDETTGQLVLESLKLYIETHKPYRDPDLTLDSLSKSSNIPSRQISSSINKFADMNFNTFINEFRVEEAKRMLRDEQYSHLNILGIGFEVGFNSKATFYAVFKKLTGMTPSRWQKQN